MIIYNSKIPKFFGYKGMTVGNLIMISHSEEDCPEWLLKHEQVHVQQQKDWWYLPYYAVYAWDYIVGRFNGLTHWGAYRDIRFEKEAYDKYGPN